MNTTELLMKMIAYDGGDPKRIHHFLKVYEFAHLIGVYEGLNQNTLEILDAAAILHDIGIHISEQKYGCCDGKHQEQEGPAEALALMRELGYEQDFMDRVCFLIGHHHTYQGVDGLDYQILIEADFLVNAYEDELPADSICAMRERIFKTETGKKLLHEIYEGETDTLNCKHGIKVLE